MKHPYSTFEFANIYNHIGSPIEIPEWDTWSIQRIIPNNNGKDVMGCYPLILIQSEADLNGGLKRLRELGLISIVFVADAFTNPSLPQMTQIFNLIKPFKTHYLHNNNLPTQYSKHHRYELKQSLKQVEVRIISLSDYLPQWIDLYQNLITHHNISGIQAFPPNALYDMGKLDGFTTIAAFHNNTMVSCHIWACSDNQVHSYLAASNKEGYSFRAAYAIYDAAIQHFSNVEIINFGGSAGLGDNPEDGLAKFKSGFSNHREIAHIYGSILNHEKYELLTKNLNPNIHYFPAYRGIS